MSNTPISQSLSSHTIGEFGAHYSPRRLREKKTVQILISGKFMRLEVKLITLRGRAMLKMTKLLCLVFNDDEVKLR